MKWVQLGALAGFSVGFLASFSLGFLGVNTEGYTPLLCGVLGAHFGGWVGWHGGLLARWCATTAVIVGAISFSAGFFIPMLHHPDFPQGPLLGIFFALPLGAMAGALLGLVLGALLESGQPADGTQRQGERPV